jgi:hypothetical protein
MTPIEAKKIIENYHKSIKDMRPDAIVQSSNNLPYVPGRIKYAHFVYGEELIKLVKITEEILQEMLESYGIINSFFHEDPEPINIKYREYLEGLRNGVITDFRMPNPFGECEPVNEFYNFLGECWFREHHTDLLSGNALGAFIYDGVRDKATKEKDIKTLIEIVNTSLTRAVRYPGKKSNAESVFIRPN